MDWLTNVVVPALASAGIAWIVTAAKARGELRKLRAEYGGAHFQHRQGVYHDLLTAERRMRLVLTQEGHSPGREGWQELVRTFHHTVNGVIIAGTQKAADAAQRIERAYGDRPSAETARANVEEIQGAAREFVAAVRDDIGRLDRFEWPK
ncbi:MAG TPA: hypothetical protein VNT32_02335 [Thermoleophilaceae bacterium]|nr:hypothetical protein [Thermoleophilaceae bacterium]